MNSFGELSPHVNLDTGLNRNYHKNHQLRSLKSDTNQQRFVKVLSEETAELSLSKENTFIRQNEHDLTVVA